MFSSIDLQYKILSRSRSLREYQVYRAGLEWDLSDPIVINGPDDFKSKPKWTDKLEPYHHQVTNLITFCRRLPVTLLADDVGLGKTISAGLILSELMSRARIVNTLIICPKLLAFQWKDELHHKFNINAEIAIGRSLLQAQPEQAGAIITTYNSTRLYLERIPHDRFQMLVLDEAHKLRNLYGTPNSPQVAKRIRRALEQRRFGYALMLTATPIQNRLWDLYSLVDLLTVARGHENPFGSEGMFSRRFVADHPTPARTLKPETRDEFRSIVFGYMSRVRRGDAKLSFPERRVQMHHVIPTAAELLLIKVISEPIQKLNRLVQISILQALTSSPEAVAAQLANMAANGTAPVELAQAVKSIVHGMPPSAKLRGLEALVKQLKLSSDHDWRMVVFTGRRETQTTIQAFLERNGLKVGIINGSSGERNQATIEAFRRDPPGIHVIVSTEAGAEGVNLQAANILVNYDLPWNPMTVEQRIGRVQRLASKFAHVVIFNITLKDTFEEYIVGRLMEKLQMAAHAIGDLEALLKGSDKSGDEDDDAASFEDKILELVLAALQGRDMAQDVRLSELSIEAAKAELEREEATIDTTLGEMDGFEYVGPRTPSLSRIVRSMSLSQFTLAALESSGAKVTQIGDDCFLSEEGGRQEYIRFEQPEPAGVRSTLYAPDSPAFRRLVSRTTATALHEVEDLDLASAESFERVARAWTERFGATLISSKPGKVHRCFEGTAMLRVRSTVTHDSYERLIEVQCRPGDHRQIDHKHALDHLEPVIDVPEKAGINMEKLASAACLDVDIAEFSRFYLERRDEETKAAKRDDRKQKKLHDDFTPSLSILLTGLKGKLHREIEVNVRYSFDGGFEYGSALVVAPSFERIISAPPLGRCAESGVNAPVSCLARCEISNKRALEHLLVTSDLTGRRALPEFAARCSVSGKRTLRDEVATSSVTGNPVATSLLRRSAVSGARAEPEFFATCQFTGATALKDELAVSAISGKHYRIDEQCRSDASDKLGHRSEFIQCEESGQRVALLETEQCAKTGKRVRVGVLGTCARSGERVMPAELETCTISGVRVLRQFVVASSISGMRMLEEHAIRSSLGTYCAPVEAATCTWSDRKTHPVDLRTCALTGMPIHLEFATRDAHPRLGVLAQMLDGSAQWQDGSHLWNDAASSIAASIGSGRCSVVAAALAPNRRCIAICAQIRSLFGMRVRFAGALYRIADRTLVGRVAVGKRSADGWHPAAQ